MNTRTRPCDEATTAGRLRKVDAVGNTAEDRDVVDELRPNPQSLSNRRKASSPAQKRHDKRAAHVAVRAIGDHHRPP